MSDSTQTESLILLPELLYEFKKYINNNLNLPMKNFIKIPEIEYSQFYINENNIFKLLFDNNYGADLGDIEDSTSGHIENHEDIIDDMYVITDEN